MPTPWWHFLATIAAWTLAIAGAVLLLHALFHDRSRGRKRCPKCWYDMAGAPSLTCPECGRAARSPKHLLRTRRHHKQVALAILIVVLAPLPAFWSVNFQWPRLVPTAFLLPLRDRLYTNIDWRSTGWRDHLTRELLQRYVDGSISDGAWRRIVAADPVSGNRATNHLQTRPVWVAGYELQLLVEDGDLRGITNRELHIRPQFPGGRDEVIRIMDCADCGVSWATVGLPPLGTHQLSFQLQLFELLPPDRKLLIWESTEVVALQTIEDLAQVLVPFDSPEQTETIKQSLNAILEPAVGRARTAFQENPIVLELSRDGRCVAIAKSFGPFGARLSPASTDDLTALVFGNNDDPTWRLDVHSDIDALLSDSARTRYWSGSFSLTRSEFRVARPWGGFDPLPKYNETE